MGAMEWNAVLEHELKEARQKAGWRWIGYGAVMLAFGLAAGGMVLAGELQTECEATAQPFETCQVNLLPLMAPAAVFFALGLAMALPAEKAAKQAKRLKVQKEAALPPGPR